MAYATTTMTDYELDSLIRGREPTTYETIRDETYVRCAQRTREFISLSRFAYTDAFVTKLSRFVCEYRAWESTREALRQREILGDSQVIRHFRAPRGLMLFGGVGTGKTTLCRLVGKMLRKSVWDVPSISVVWSRDGWEALEAFEKNELVILDDLGSESDAKYFGESGGIVHLLSNRYNRFVKTGVPTILTTNLMANGIRKRYGERIISRFAEMFDVIPMGGDDHRMQ